MRQPQMKAIVFFIGILGVGYAIGTPIITGLLGASFDAAALANLTAFAFLFAVIMTVILDKPLELELFKWPEKKEKAASSAAPLRTEPVVETSSESTSTADVPPGQLPHLGGEFVPGGLFPHEVPTEHWDADFGDGRQVYEGSELPIWILAGWAVFILWAVVYLLFAVRFA